MQKKLGISFVIPCLNEEITLPLVLEKIKSTIKNNFSDRKTEIIVTDNGSSDNSIKIAKSYGAKVLKCEEKGYGANLMNGFKGAENDLIIFADADNTYDFQESTRLVKKIEEGNDFVLGTRIKGNIKKKAMPFLHKYLGTPFLTFLINLFFSFGGNKISDCNSGFRCFYRKHLKALNLVSSGMEFASEMLISAFQNKLHIAEVPISLSPDHKDRKPTLKTWNDGTRHLLQILSATSHFFFWLGFSLWLISLAIIVLTIFNDIIYIRGIGLLGIHTTLIAFGINIVGLQIWNIGMFITKVPKNSFISSIYTRLKGIREDKFFYILCLFFIYTISIIVWVIYQWFLNNYQLLAIEKKLVLILTIFISFFHFIIGLLITRLIDRT